ncbi:hypothetical protein B0H11DRAFT_260462 [Mycena galericulata]|nr:hypothetical protein B0H11DRAFT_260462 [Mycena galericulata]
MPPKERRVLARMCFWAAVTVTCQPAAEQEQACVGRGGSRANHDPTSSLSIGLFRGIQRRLSFFGKTPRLRIRRLGRQGACEWRM